MEILRIEKVSLNLEGRQILKDLSLSVRDLNGARFRRRKSN